MLQQTKYIINIFTCLYNVKTRLHCPDFTFSLKKNNFLNFCGNLRCSLYFLVKFLSPFILEVPNLLS
jgi:hypothetical protein